MTTLILDYSKWRCGGSGSGVANAPDTGKGVGKGPTRLLNDEGFMCPIGQWTQQLHPEFEILNCGTPGHLKEKYEFTTPDGTEDSYFATDAMFINDRGTTTIQEKIKELTKLCKDHGYKLKVINAPAQ